MLDRAFKQEKSNIMENTFPACNICKGRMIKEINNGTACASGFRKIYQTPEGFVFVAVSRIFL